MNEILKYFPDLSSNQVLCFEKLGNLYRDWNQKINVISRQDIEQLYIRHVLHSLSIAKVISFRPETRILDVGTGGGFPGIPMAILFPDVHFTLIDSVGKKIKVVQAIAADLELKNIEAFNTRVEEVKEKFEFVVSRAVTAFPQFVKMVRKNISADAKNSMPNGIFYLKGGDFQEEIKDFARSVEVFEIANFFSNPFFETKKIVFLPSGAKTFKIK